MYFYLLSWQCFFFKKKKHLHKWKCLQRLRIAEKLCANDLFWWKSSRLFNSYGLLLFYFRERVHVPSHSLVMLALTACRTSWSTSPSTMASASISSVWVSVSCRSSFFPWGETNHLLQCVSHPFTVKANWFCPVTHLLNTDALMESSCRNSQFGFIHTLISFVAC